LDLWRLQRTSALVDWPPPEHPIERLGGAESDRVIPFALWSSESL